MQDIDEESQSTDEQEPDPIGELRQRTIRGVSFAIDWLTNEAMGRGPASVDDHKLRVCFILARLAPALLRRDGEQQQADDAMPEYPRGMDPVEADRLLCEMEQSRREHTQMLKDKGITEGEWRLQHRAEIDAEFDRHQAAAREYERKHGIRSW